MSLVNVDVLGEDELKQARELLAGIPNGAHKALGAAIRRGASYLRTNSAKAIQERYDISTANIRANENVTIRYMGYGNLDATIRFAGGKIPLFRYGGASPGAPAFDQSQLVPMMIHGKWLTAHPGVPAHGHQRKDTAPALFEHAFVARMGSGHVGIFERNGGSTRDGGDAISEVMGLSVAQMVGNDQVKEKLAKDTAEKVAERYHHEVVRLLNGWGN